MLTYAEIDYLNVEHYFYYVYHHLHITRTKKKNNEQMTFIKVDKFHSNVFVHNN